MNHFTSLSLLFVVLSVAVLGLVALCCICCPVSLLVIGLAGRAHALLRTRRPTRHCIRGTCSVLWLLELLSGSSGRVSRGHVTATDSVCSSILRQSLCGVSRRRHNLVILLQFHIVAATSHVLLSTSAGCTLVFPLAHAEAITDAVAAIATATALGLKIARTGIDLV